MDFLRLGVVVDPSVFEFDGAPLSHAANPVVVKLKSGYFRIFFNARDKSNRSSVFSVDYDLANQRLFPETFRPQFILESRASYFGDGVSLGTHFILGSRDYISFMAWKNPKNAHWFGTLGRLLLSDSLDFESIDNKPWLDLDDFDNISFSYPSITDLQGTFIMWYGSTISWDVGNGEMLHVLRERISFDGTNFVPTGREIPWHVPQAQAFSRPSILRVESQTLMAYSYRGSENSYRIGFVWLEDLNSSSSNVNGLAAFLPSMNPWESEMVEYPYLLNFCGETYMFYNGNGYGKTGIGLARIIIN